MLTVALILILSSVALSGLIGWLIGNGHGRKKCNAEWEDEWEDRKGWLRPVAVIPEHAYAAPVHRRIVDAVSHPTVVEPIRTETIVGYRGRHSTDEPTGPIPRDGEFTQEIKRLTAGYYASATAHVLASRGVA